jgi:hypothetical protein
MQYVVVCILLGIAICIFLLYRSRIEGFAEQHNNNNIPAIIWTYWNSEEIPEIVQLCIASWRRHNPTYEVRVLTPATLGDYIDVDVKSLSFIDSPAREADAVRLLVLEQFGGVWSDATVLATQPYSFSRDNTFVGYYMESFTSDERFPVLEAWFFATVPHGSFITKWRKAFFMLEEFESAEEAVNSVRESTDLQKINGPAYLFINVAAQSVMQNHPDLVKQMTLRKAEEGPYQYITKNGWNSTQALEDLCRGNYKTDLIKFRGAERKILMDREDLKKCIFDQGT